MMIELPNDKWVRSTQNPKYAVCLDMDARFFGWLMYEGVAYGKWVSARKLSYSDAEKLHSYNEFQHLRTEIDVLLEELGE